MKDKRATEKTIRIVEDNPIEQIYTQLRALSSKAVVRECVKRNSKNSAIALSEEHSIAFMEAEMFIYGDQYKNPEEIEKITKSGHGLRTFGDAVDSWHQLLSSDRM